MKYKLKKHTKIRLKLFKFLFPKEHKVLFDYLDNSSKEKIEQIREYLD